MESADKTSKTDNDSNIQTVGTDASWSDKGEDEQKRPEGADTAHVADVLTSTVASTSALRKRYPGSIPGVDTPALSKPTVALAKPHTPEGRGA